MRMTTHPLLSIVELSQTVTLGSETLTILQGISFTINRGETVAILGASGSGKSTLLGLLAGLDSPSSGEIIFEGRNLFQLDEDKRAALRARKIGFVFQNFQLLPTLTALENVMLPLELARVDNAEDKALQWLNHVSLGNRVGHTPRQLSGGEQQRVALARAFAQEPQLILADEPTGSLDTHTGETVADLMFKLNQERQTTLVLVTHDLALASRCKRRLSLNAGVLKESLR